MRTLRLSPLFFGFCLACQGVPPLAPPPGSAPDQAPEVRAEPIPPSELAQAKPRTSHPVFSLRDNRHLAHLRRGEGLALLAGTPGFAKYLHFGRPSLSWRLGEEKEGHKVALPNATATLSLPLTAEQLGANSLWLRLYAPRAATLSVEIAGKKAGSTALVAGWQTAEIALAPGLLREGENRLSLSGVSGAAVEWLQLGGAFPQEAPKLDDPSAKALVLSQGEGFDFVVQIPAQGTLSGTVQGKGCAVDLSAETSDGAKATGTLRGQGAVDLSSLAGRVVRLSLRGAGCAEARLVEGALSVPGAAPEVTRPKAPKYVVMWIMDTLRADKMRLYNPKARAETPVFEELAKKGAVFRNAYSQGNESRAGHASIWTSLYPVNHRMIGSKSKLAPELITIDEPMKDAGMYASGISCNGYITDKWGFGTRWDHYRNHIHDGGGVKGENILNAGILSVEKKRSAPFFLYLGTVDTHVSWRAHEPWLSKYDPEPYKGPWTKTVSGIDLEKTASGAMKITERDKVRALAMYDVNVSYQDELVGQLIAKLKEWGIFEETMLVFSADHGEELWEHGTLSHGASQRESLVHVPLVVYYPPLFPGGFVDEGADTLDIMPTMLDALGKPIPESLQGASLLPLAQGQGRGYPRPSFSSQYEKAHTMRLGAWKLHVNSAGVVSLFDIDADFDERKDLAAERPLERRFVTDALSTFLVYQRQWKKWKWGVASNVTPAFSAELD